MVPVSCYYTGRICLHQASYTVAKGDTYLPTVSDTFRGLSSCQALLDQNYHTNEDFVVGAQLMDPLRCACPSTNGRANGVKSLLTYLVMLGNSGNPITESFGVTVQSVMEQI